MSASASAAVRRPLLNIVVLFASDSRVYAYSRLVAQRFADCGVDVFLQVRARARRRGGSPHRHARGRAAPAPPRLRAHPLSPDRFTPPASPPSCLFFCAARRRT